MKLAIIGGGAAGTAVLYRLSLFKNRLYGWQIFLFEKSGVLGPGTPHQDQSASLLVNMAVIAHSIHPFDPMHFSLWLQKTYGWISETPIPRCWFGRYLQESSVEAMERLEQANVRIEMVHQEVIAISQTSDKLLRIRSHQMEWAMDHVVLALGHQRPTLPFRIQSVKKETHAS